MHASRIPGGGLQGGNTAALPAAAAQEGWKMTRNQDLNVLHVDDAAAFVRGLRWRLVAGDTLLFDFVYFLHPVRAPEALHAPL
jgi:hypothetical protein